MTTNSNPAVPRFDLKEWRERFIRTVLRIASVLGVIMMGVSFPTSTLRDKILYSVLYLILISITLLPTPYILRAYLLLLMVGLIGVNAVVAWGPWADGSIFLLSTIVLASLLLDNRTDIFVLVAFILFVGTLGFLTLQDKFHLIAPKAPKTTVADWGVYLADFSITAVILTTAANMLKSAFGRVVDQMQGVFNSLTVERQSLEEKVQERTAELETRMSQLRASALTARAIAETQEISQLLEKAANLISERFGYYHVGVYILDDLRRNAYLQASSSETGKSLLGQTFRVEPDRRNPLSMVVETNQPILTSDLDKTTYARDVTFPLTRSRMIMPLSVRSSTIGLIDIHSDQPRAFSSQDAEVLQILVDLTAISFDNVRLIEETRNLISQLQANTSLQTQRTWSKFVSRHKSAYLYTPAGVRPVFSQEKHDMADGLSIPIILHGQAIGKINLRKRKGFTSNEWSDRERDVIEKISNQVALALENSRLVDEAQKNALRNQMIANFSTYVRETLDVEEVVRAAATELRRVFDLKEAEIMIGPTQTDSSAQS
ncbi:MAG: GAF domain-containing protein [Anaerolineales bacterium]|nr:GAF domain-containing protein [Anaerolineales bacterium]MCB9112468.1 GAF domain-containing protein [Anaerolineales bacterium]